MDPLTETTTLDQNRHGSNGNEAVFHTLESFITGALHSNGLLSYPGHMAYPLCRDTVSVLEYSDSDS